MSLGALLTELDLAIIRYLKSSDISRLSRSSKYYREVAEPLLYESIHFWTDEYVDMKKLFLTLVFRKSLRAKILKVGVHHEPKPQDPRPIREEGSYKMDDAGFELCEDLMANANEIHTFVSDLTTQHGLSSQLNMSMFAKVFEPLPHFDGCLALILCMATQLRTLHLDLHGEALKTTELVLTGIDWRDTKSMSGDHPFQALRDLCIQATPSASGRMPSSAGFRVSILPPLEHLTIRNNRKLHVSGFNHSLPATMTTLTLQDVYFQPSTLREILRLPFSRTIEHLTISGIANVTQYWTNMASIWNAHEYHKLKATVLKYLPGLRCFHWTEMGHWGNVEPFGSFSEFEKLEELVIDHDALSSNLGLLSFDELLRCGEVLDYFPPSLEILELAGFSWDEPQIVCAQYVKNTTIEVRPDQLPRFYALIAALPMKEIFLNITFTHERHDDGCGAILPASNDPLLMFLKSTAEQLDSLGTKFTVWYKIHNSTVESQLLVGPSYFAPECYEECCENFADRYRVEPIRFSDHYHLDEMEEAPSSGSAEEYTPMRRNVDWGGGRPKQQAAVDQGERIKKGRGGKIYIVDDICARDKSLPVAEMGIPDNLLCTRRSRRVSMNLVP